MSRADRQQLTDTADRIVSRLQNIDEKVNIMRMQINNDPDSLGDKLFKYALPSLAGMLAGKVFKSIWDRSRTSLSLSSQESDEENQEGLIASIAFAGLSAALTAIVSQLSDKGSQALIDRRHAHK
jgi:hypothetical protein